ncbi:pyrroline-5-carboxylate reductase family protein [Falsiroseomonas oryzae]|uniref:pyrroline-5-carboxylate reductase family protein n=1 Tax=Falsiroseomonas oryzae TaxID=2766473 RepID=UPI0022EA948A|nr:pyrroline-5-carboxylate reductase dimerization domain-containing protein [Roseomonas sp. MO-31]
MSATRPATAFIGVGTMMEAMIDKAIAAGWPREKLLPTHRRADRRAELAQRYGLPVGDDNLAAATSAELVVVGVRPQEMPGLLQELAPAFRPSHVLLSIAAGLTVEWLQARLPAGTTVIRVTPPPTAWVSAGVTLFSASEGVTADQRATVEALVEGTCERIEWVPDALMEPITGVALGLTPYTCMVLKTLIETGVEQGCDEAFIRRMVADGLRATAKLLSEGGFQPEQVIEMVATRQGLTWSALHTMEVRGVFAGIRAGARAMTGRSYELRGETVPDDHMGFLR